VATTDWMQIAAREQCNPGSAFMFDKKIYKSHLRTLAGLAPPACTNWAANCFPDRDVTRAETNVRGNASLLPWRKSSERIIACITPFAPSNCSTETASKTSLSLEVELL